MKKKRMAYTILFCVWIGLNYFGIFGTSAQELADYLACHREPPVYLSTFQLWFFNILSTLVDSILVGAATGIFAYHYRHLKTWHYIALAISVRYFAIVFFLPFAMWDHSLSEIAESTAGLAPAHEIAILALIQLALTVLAAFVGISCGRNAEYLDEKDEELGYVGGVSKKTWAVLMLLFNPVARFSTDLSLVILYQFSKDVSSSAYWKTTLSNLFSSDPGPAGGILSLLFKFVLVWVIWCITCFIFYFGVQTVRHKDASYRLIKILAIFVALPAAILVIPLIRNRTWFF